MTEGEVVCCKENLCELRRQVYFHICSYKRPSIYNVILDMRGGGPNILQYYLAPCWSGGLMSLLDLFGLVDLVCQLVWYFLAILLHPKGFSNGSIVQNEYPNELDDPQVFVGLKSFQMKARAP